MPTATSCLYLGKVISIDEALDICRSQKAPKGTFTCIECKEPVKPHKGGGHSSAHFEHFSRNSNCRFSHPFNRETYSSPKEYYDPEDSKAIEGYEVDRHMLSKARNAGLAKKCKERDKYTCQACGFSLKIHGKHIVECHHTIMVSTGRREVTIDELVTLCPTCHRIAHTRNIPYSVDELRKFRK